MAGNKSLKAAVRAKEDEFTHNLQILKRNYVTINNTLEGKQSCVIVMIRLKATFSNISF